MKKVVTVICIIVLAMSLLVACSEKSVKKDNSKWHYQTA